MQKRSFMFVMAVITILALLLSGCKAASGPKTYVLVPKNLGNPYFDTANKGAQAAAAELNFTVQYNGPAAADATQQIQLLNSLIAQKVSGLAISADDKDALVSTGQAATKAGIPCVSWDSAIARAVASSSSTRLIPRELAPSRSRWRWMRLARQAARSLF